MRTIYIFTTCFPYSTSENFLEDEIIYLSRLFDKVVILPFTNTETTIRPIPDNCVVKRISINNNRIKYIILGLFHPLSFGILMKEFFRSKVFLSKKRLFAWGSSARYLNNCLYNRKLRSVFKEITHDDVCYSYWGIGQCLLSIVLNGKVKFVSRFHGEWDLWEENYGGFHSLRREVARCLDRALFVSKKGEAYFKQRYPYAHTAYCPLGTKDYGTQLDNPQDGVLRIISCSSVYPLKRVPLLFEALNHLVGFTVEWTHIGDGKELEALKEKIAREKRSHLTVNLVGHLSNEDVLSYYSCHHFDLFVNVSTSEGVPVSIMEAMSFNIPILATDVGGTSEEVVPQVGMLLPPNPTLDEIAAAIEKMIGTDYGPRAYWEEHYKAEKNYKEFAEMLYML